MSLRIISFVLFAVAVGGCTSSSGLLEKKQTKIPGFKTPPASKIKSIGFNFVGGIVEVEEGKTFAGVPGRQNMMQGPPLHLNDKVELTVVPIDSVVKPLIEFRSPEMDIKQKSKSAKFAFAVTSSLMTQNTVDVEIQVNKGEVVVVRFDILH
jgi:hypothetical protein